MEFEFKPLSLLKIKANITTLPLDVYRIIQKYTSINCLLLVCKSLTPVVRSCYHLNLNEEGSRYYYEDVEFRYYLNFKYLENCSLQLSLNFSSNFNMDMKVINAIVPNLHSLSICNNHLIKNVSILNNIHILNLSGCFQLKQLNSLFKLHTVNLSETSISDVTSLKDVYSLELVDCENLIDISPLCNVHYLKPVRPRSCIFPRLLTSVIGLVM